MYTMNPIETWIQKSEVKLIVEKAEDFGKGIAEAFVRLAEKLNTPGVHRDCYGIVLKEDGQMNYYAAFTELREGEASEMNLPAKFIEAGNYQSILVNEWNNNLLYIGPTFDRLLQSGLVDTNADCIEYYKTEQELICMIKSLEV